MRRVLVGSLVVLVLLGGAAWYWQSELIGFGARWYLTRMASSEGDAGGLEKRRRVVAQMNRMLLMGPAPDAIVPELFDVVTALSSRAATGAMSLNWSAYVYTTYQQDMLRDRPDGAPRRTPEQVEAEVQRLVAFYAIQKRPETQGIRVGDLLGTGDDSISLEEIEEADRTGKAIDLRQRGAN
ncbi:MAG: hypothetical protein KIT14_24620 [bacterium]|nr:hypothetical protein [bacterium]